jgi:hypothetical protein
LLEYEEKCYHGWFCKTHAKELEALLVGLFEIDGIKARDAFHDIGVSHTHNCTFFYN